MDKEQATFVLQCFRADGSDARDPDFAEALAAAAEDRELGEWFARERALDAAFAEALANVAVPVSLRQGIDLALAAERGDFPQAGDDLDAAMIGSLASVQVPDALRHRVLTAMQRSASVLETSRTAWWKRPSLAWAAAAGIALALGLSLLRQPAGSDTLASGPVPISELERGVLHAYQSPLFKLEVKNSNQQVLVSHLNAKSLPVSHTLPAGLRGMESIGCRELNIDGKRGSMICFEADEAGVVHLVVFRRSDVAGDLPCVKRPDVIKMSENWASAHWADEQFAYLLVGHTGPETLTNLF